LVSLRGLAIRAIGEVTMGAANRTWSPAPIASWSCPDAGLDEVALVAYRWPRELREDALLVEAEKVFLPV
jgi:hypothetical protein